MSCDRLVQGVIGMKIAISGCAGVGKTLTTQVLSEKLTLITGEPHTAITGIGRKVMIQRYGDASIYTKLNECEMLDLKLEIIKQKIYVENNVKNFVADRSILDYLGLAVIHCWKLLSWDNFESLLDECSKHNQMYEKIFMLQHGSIPLENDNIRFTHETYQFLVEMVGRGLYHKLSSTIVEINEVEINRRIHAILQNIQ